LEIQSVSVKDLHQRLGFKEALEYPKSSLNKPLTQWLMEVDDSPIFRYIYRSFRPKRHLEFGTWGGTGLLYCLQECDATAWTINLLKGETGPDDKWAYSNKFKIFKHLPDWANRKIAGTDGVFLQTDTLSFIGRFYLDAGMGHRVCQIYCDSRQWDTNNYPSGFFDTALIDGGHSEEVVKSDSEKAFKLVRPGGVIMWHDYCPKGEVQNSCSSTRGVQAAIKAMHSLLEQQMSDVFWIDPSWILLGVKK
jgi:hypothetical protein